MSVLRLDSNEPQPHPRPDDRLLERPIVRRAPAHRSAAIRRRRRATRFSLLTRLVLRPASSKRGHRARVAVPREQEQRRARWERCVERCQVVV